MFQQLFASLDLVARAERMRRAHSEWLTGAFKRGASPPRIPLRKVSDGGWGSIMSTPEGQAWAREFWEQALEHPDAQ